MLQTVEAGLQDQAVRGAQEEEMGWSEGQSVSTMQAQDCRFLYMESSQPTLQCIKDDGWAKEAVVSQKLGGWMVFQRFMPLVLFWVFCHKTQIHEIIKLPKVHLSTQTTALNISLDLCSSSVPYHFSFNLKRFFAERVRVGATGAYWGPSCPMNLHVIPYLK